MHKKIIINRKYHESIVLYKWYKHFITWNGTLKQRVFLQNGMGNNPMVGATVAVAVSVEEAAKAGRF